MNTTQQSLDTKPTGGYSALKSIDQTRSTQMTLSDQVGSIRTQVRHLDVNTRELHEKAYRDDLEQVTRDLGKLDVKELLGKLNNYGFAWRDVAKMTGVSVPALQKWRRGERITGENRLRLASVVAVVEVVEKEMLVSDPASWFEMPIKQGVHLTPIDLLASGKPLLVFELASQHGTPEGVLDQFDTQWRDNLMDAAFETFIATDGVRSIRPRG